MKRAGILLNSFQRLVAYYRLHIIIIVVDLFFADRLQLVFRGVFVSQLFYFIKTSSLQKLEDKRKAIFLLHTMN